MNQSLLNHFKKIVFFYFFLSFFTTFGQSVTTFAGSTAGFADGLGTTAQFNGPAGVAVADDGTLYVADRINNRIRKVMPDGTVTTIAGSVNGYADGVGTAALFDYPMFLDLDSSGNIYVADSGNHRIRKITPTGVVTTIAGGNTDGFLDGVGTAALFYYPEGIAVDAAGIIYVSDAGNQRIRKISLDNTVTTIAGNGNFGYVDGVGTAAEFKTPSGIDIDSAGNLYVAEKQNHCIRKITPSGVVTTVAGNGTSGYLDGVGTAAKFNVTFDVKVDGLGNLYVVDASNNRIRKIDSAGMVTTFAGSTAGHLDGVGTAAKFNYPIGICVANDGTIFVGESGNSIIRKIVNTLSTVDYELLNQVVIYPNPTSSFVHIDLGSLLGNELTLMDMKGRIIQSKKDFDSLAVLNVEHLANGIYLLDIKTDKGSITKKIIKE